MVQRDKRYYVGKLFSLWKQLTLFNGADFWADALNT